MSVSKKKKNYIYFCCRVFINQKSDLIWVNKIILVKNYQYQIVTFGQ